MRLGMKSYNDHVSQSFLQWLLKGRFMECITILSLGKPTKSIHKSRTGFRYYSIMEKTKLGGKSHILDLLILFQNGTEYNFEKFLTR